MTTSDVVAALPYALPFIVGILTVVVTRTNNRSAEVTARLTSQRADFEAIVDPLSKELASYREQSDRLQTKVRELEGRLGEVEVDRRLLVAAVSTLKGHIDLHLPDKPVVLPPRVVFLLDRQGEP